MRHSRKRCTRNFSGRKEERWRFITLRSRMTHGQLTANAGRRKVNFLSQPSLTLNKMAARSNGRFFVVTKRAGTNPALFVCLYICHGSSTVMLYDQAECFISNTPSNPNVISFASARTGSNTSMISSSVPGATFVVWSPEKESTL